MIVMDHHRRETSVALAFSAIRSTGHEFPCRFNGTKNGNSEIFRSTLTDLLARFSRNFRLAPLAAVIPLVLVDQDILVVVGASSYGPFSAP